MVNSAKMYQCPRIEFNFSNNNSSKFRVNDPIMNKILE